MIFWVYSAEDEPAKRAVEKLAKNAKHGALLELEADEYKAVVDQRVFPVRVPE